MPGPAYEPAPAKMRQRTMERVDVQNIAKHINTIEISSKPHTGHIKKGAKAGEQPNKVRSYDNRCWIRDRADPIP